MKQQNIEKYILPASIVLVGLYLANKFFGKSKSETDTAHDIQQGGAPTYTNTVYNQFADAIQAANLEHFFTDSDSIKDVFRKLKKDVDFLKLVEAFGTRRPKFSATVEALGAFLHGALNDTQINSLNTILQQNGLKSRI